MEYPKTNGEWTFCVFEQIGDNYIGRVLTTRNIYQRVPTTIFFGGISLFCVVFVLAQAVVHQMDKHVVNKIDELNDKLQSIASGNLDEKLDMKSSVEFDKLSGYINYMVNSLLENNKKMSYALGKTNIQVGTYEYSSHSDRVQYTEYVPELFSITNEQMKMLSLDKELFIRFLDEVKKNPVPNEEGIYIHKKLYVRIEEITSIEDIFGVVVDVTAQMKKRKEIEKERHRQDNQLKAFDNHKLPGKKKLEDNIVDYVQSSEIGLNSSDDLYKKPIDNVAESVKLIVDIEGPIHISEVTKRIKDSCHIKRAGANLKRTVNAAIENAESSGKIIKIGDFLYDASTNGLKQL